jgi:hypothetical protein
MADINVKFRAAELGKSLENLAYEVQQELDQAIKDTANGAYASIVAKAQAELNSTRADYIKGLQFEELGNNTYLITLEGDWANALEDGFSGFDIREWMLSSEKVVQVGTRTGQKWVQTGKNGKKFAHVPFEHRPHSKAPQASDLGQAIKKLQAFNRSGRSQKFTSIFKDASGNPMEGRVASVKKVEGFPQLDGITKYQKIYKNESTGKQSVQSVYMTFRTVSENSDSWRHPGFQGLGAFAEAERWVEEQIDNIINTLIK